MAQLNELNSFRIERSRAKLSLGLPVQAWLFLILGTLCSCGTQVETPRGLQTSLQAPSGNQNAPADYNQGITQLDLKAEDAISHECVDAWRKAIAGDCNGAMKELKLLDQKYPKVATIRFMMGQVLEKCGKKKEAIQYYQDSVRQFEFSSIHLYKLAEAMRTTGDAKGSIPQYRKLLATAPDFTDGKLGLAKALLQADPQSTEAQQQINEILKMEPDNKEALAMLHEKSATAPK